MKRNGNYGRTAFNRAFTQDDMNKGEDYLIVWVNVHKTYPKSPKIPDKLVIQGLVVSQPRTHWRIGGRVGGQQYHFQITKFYKFKICRFNAAIHVRKQIFFLTFITKIRKRRSWKIHFDARSQSLLLHITKATTTMDYADKIQIIKFSSYFWYLLWNLFTTTWWIACRKLLWYSPIFSMILWLLYDYYY